MWYPLYILLVVFLYTMAVLEYFPHIFLSLALLLAFIPISYKAIIKLQKKIIGTELFITIATVISYLGHQEQAMGIVLIIMLIAEYLEDLISNKTEKEIHSLLHLIPQTALIKLDDEEKLIPLQALQQNMIVIVKTGARIPVDGIIVEGSALINDAALTGESIPQYKIIGQQVFAGTFIESGYLLIKTEKVGEETFFGKINNMVQQAEQKKAKIAFLTDKIAFYLVPSILFVIGLIWLLTHNLMLVTTLLVFGSPLELTIITPIAILSGIIAAFRNGILVKGGLVLEKFSHAKIIIFDKTGTLTMGEPVVNDIKVYGESSPQEILKIAAIAEKRSEHVLGKAILKKAQEEHLIIPDPQEYNSLAGHGVEIMYDHKKCFIGNRHFIEAPEHGNISIPNESEQELSSIFVACGNKVLGKIYITDNVRAEAQESIANLKKLGIKDFYILSGDKQIIASKIAAQLGISEAYGEVFPDQKLLMIQKLQQEGKIAVMVGDGINDAPALKQADVGIAMGALGIEPAIEAADIVLMTNDLNKIAFTYALSKKIFKVIHENLIFGFALIHGAGIILTFLGYIDPFRAALFHAVSDLLILLNSVRLMNFKG